MFSIIFGIFGAAEEEAEEGVEVEADVAAAALPPLLPLFRTTSFFFSEILTGVTTCC